jgi:hypothetical protein
VTLLVSKIRQPYRLPTAPGPDDLRALRAEHRRVVEDRQQRLPLLRVDDRDPAIGRDVQDVQLRDAVDQQRRGQRARVRPGRRVERAEQRADVLVLQPLQRFGRDAADDPDSPIARFCTASDGLSASSTVAPSARSVRMNAARAR